MTTKEIAREKCRKTIYGRVTEKIVEHQLLVPNGTNTICKIDYDYLYLFDSADGLKDPISSFVTSIFGEAAISTDDIKIWDKTDRLKFAAHDTFSASLNDSTLHVKYTTTHSDNFLFQLKALLGDPADC